VHTPLPVKGLYVPCAHPLHVPPLGPVYPALQVQDINSVDPVASVELPAGQVVHAPAPVDCLYVPVGQAVHVPPDGPVNPILQLQDVTMVFPVVDVKLLAGQFIHTVDEVPPEVPEYLPAWQFMHVLTEDAPEFTEYLPTLQSVHTVRPVTEVYLPATQNPHN
jgi:hypothetical protein